MAGTMTLPNETPSIPGPSNSSSTPDTPRRNNRPSQSKVSIHQVYALPAPIRTFPLPTFNPSNPISLAHLVYAWVKQVISPPAAEPSVIHQGVWDPNTRSVHVKDPKSIRALWEQGFYGKGSLSRSEPNWLKREQNRRDTAQTQTVSEQRTEARREERRLVKWERAKAELEAIERQRQVEAEASTSVIQEELPVNGVNGDLKEPEAPVTPQDSATLPGSSVVAVESPEALEEEPYVLVADVKETLVPVVNGSCEPKAPVTPSDLLALPNSFTQKYVTKQQNNTSFTPNGLAHLPQAPVTPAALLVLPNSSVDFIAVSVAEKNGLPETSGPRGFVAGSSHVDAQANGILNHEVVTAESDIEWVPKAGDGHLSDAAVNGTSGETNGSSSPTPSLRSNASAGAGSCQGKPGSPLKRRKSVRFSPQVESTTFQHTDPPSPNHSTTNTLVRRSPSPVTDTNGPGVAETVVPPPVQLASPPENMVVSTPVTVPVGDLVDKEHFQLAPEEAFFLVFALGALSVVDPDTGAPIPTDHLLTLLRSYSYFPPRQLGPSVKDVLLPSDPFLVQYAVYHHYRSLGWVPRHGIKFGVDFIIYQRGPVFDHSEFGLIVIPSFSDSRWKDIEHDTPKRSWSWLMGVNRVLSHVLKSLVLVYVDVPPPPVFEEVVRKGGIARALKAYKIREVMVRRFSVNRNR
ncbi:hypothetical protein V8F06_012985 [Rhypophila decipiens]